MNFILFALFTISCLAAQKKKKVPFAAEKAVIGEWTFDTYTDVSQDPIETVMYNITIIDNQTMISPIVDGVQEEPIGHIEAEGKKMTIYIGEEALLDLTFAEINGADIYSTQFVKDGLTYDVIIYNQRFPTFIINVFGGEEKKTIIVNRTVIVPPKGFFAKYGMLIMIVVFGILMLGKGVGPQAQQQGAQAAAPAAEAGRAKAD